MKNNLSVTSITLSTAALSLAFMMPGIASAQSMSNMQAAQGDNQNRAGMSSSAGAQEAMQMVPARAAIDRTLNAKDAKPGQEFEAKLPNTVHLKNGTELPRGTMLVGKVSEDDMSQAGNSKLALRISEAKLKDGKVVPVKATIVGIFPSGSVGVQAEAVSPGDQTPNPWTPGTQQVDQLDALSGVNLHSKIGSNNSGVLVSKKDDIKVKAGTELALAIAAGE